MNLNVLQDHDGGRSESLDLRKHDDSCSEWAEFVCSYGGRISAAMKIFSTSSDRMLRRCARFRFTSSFFSSLEGFSLKYKEQSFTLVLLSCFGLIEMRLACVSIYLAGLLALHDLEDGVFECVVDKGGRRGLHVLLHQGAGEGGRSEQCRGFI